MTEANKEYAKALFALALQENAVVPYDESLTLLRGVFEEFPDYTEFLRSPALPLSERIAAIDKAFASSQPEHVVSFLKLLCENGHVESLPLCAKEFHLLRRQHENRATATVYSVVPLSDEQKMALCKKLSEIYKKTIDAVYLQDPTLLGGVKVELDGMTLDGSTKQRLAKVKGVMKGE